MRESECVCVCNRKRESIDALKEGKLCIKERGREMYRNTT